LEFFSLQEVSDFFHSHWGVSSLDVQGDQALCESLSQANGSASPLASAGATNCLRRLNPNVPGRTNPAGGEMKKVVFGTLIAAAVLFILPLVVPAGTGNGAPNGPHYDLNIIGVSNPKSADMTNSNRHTIFVALGKKNTVATNIWLTPGPFQVCDGNGFDQATDCNGNPIQVPGQAGNQPGAVFQLPCDTLTNGDVVNPCDPTVDTAAYSIYARALGTPYGSADVTTCAYDTTTLPATLVCSTNNHVFLRSKGKSSFIDVTSLLTTIVTSTTSYEIFSPLLQDYFWQYTNSGLKLLQLRFYLVPSS
jgi:hypothetical protein